MDINSVVISGNLTRDPELRTTAGGTPVCQMRVAVNGRRKNSADAWVDDPSFFNVTTFGAHAEACGEYLAKGRPVMVQGRLESQEWEAKDGSGKRFGIQIIGMVKFAGYKPDSELKQDSGGDDGPEPVGAGADREEEIPF